MRVPIFSGKGGSLGAQSWEEVPEKARKGGVFGLPMVTNAQDRGISFFRDRGFR